MIKCDLKSEAIDVKKIFYSILLFFTISIVLQGCNSRNEMVDNSKLSESTETKALESKPNLSLKDFVGTYRGMNENTENISMSIEQSEENYIITNTRENTGTIVLKDSNMRYYLEHGQSDDWDCLEYIDGEGREYQFRKRNKDSQLIISICQNEFVELYTNE